MDERERGWGGVWWNLLFSKAPSSIDKYVNSEGYFGVVPKKSKKNMKNMVIKNLDILFIIKQYLIIIYSINDLVINLCMS